MSHFAVVWFGNRCLILADLGLDRKNFFAVRKPIFGSACPCRPDMPEARSLLYFILSSLPSFWEQKTTTDCFAPCLVISTEDTTKQKSALL